MCGVTGLVASFTSSSSAMCEWESMMPGVRYLPPASITVALGGRVHVFADRGNFSVLDVNAAVLNVAVGDGHHHGVLDQNFIVR